MNKIRFMYEKSRITYNDYLLKYIPLNLLLKKSRNGYLLFCNTLYNKEKRPNQSLTSKGIGGATTSSSISSASARAVLILRAIDRSRTRASSNSSNGANPETSPCRYW